MASLNVNRNVTDLYYRYKMPRIMAKVEGKGNGIRTVILNMVEVARSLGRPPTYTTKYFGCELGALTRVDLKNDRYIVNGSHDANRLQTLLDGFIKEYVLCRACDNPETVLLVSQKRGTIDRTCKACGHLSHVDLTHKLTAFILKNPPEDCKKSKNGGGTEAADNNDDIMNHSPTHEEADDDDWSVDVSPEAVKRRMEDLSNGVKNLAVTDDLEKTEKERIDILYNYVKAKKEAGKLAVAGVDKDILNEAERLDVRDKGTLVLAELLFDSSILLQASFIDSNAKLHRLLFLRFCHENPKAQKYLLGGIEQVISMNKVLLPKVSHILKSFYDMDILEEDVLLDWGKRVSKKYVTKELSEAIHTKAQPFITWLRDAEESSSEEESDEEDDVEISYDDRASGAKIKPVVQTNGANHNEADDFDIDTI
ncbi:unnamed protein product [Notodromas monacha]|uniref:Eukaryotic translation initiation factor 5 n=1 Tax=Notodromas monacha TaxID=399045 RepID=A0A7R9BVI2_9CRUS|nr:unnamed protein product [Notodromas monacha]CAG0922511.1 unnamed protein product [Notodromas monacha]